MRNVALLRAINVGGHVVKMDALRRLFEAMKLENVETFIASGNVLFDAPSDTGSALEARIEKSLKKALGYDVGTFVRSGDELAAIAEHQSFPFPKNHSLYVIFLKSALDAPARTKVAGLCSAIDAFHPHGREVYWVSRPGMGQSPASGPLLRTLGPSATIRSVTTVRKLAAKCGA